MPMSGHDQLIADTHHGIAGDALFANQWISPIIDHPFLEAAGPLRIWRM